MRKTVIFMIVTLMLTSCFKDNVKSGPDMNYFGNMLVRNTLFCPVTSLSELEMEKGEAIFAPNYETLIEKNGYIMTVTGIPERDSTWKVEGLVEKTRFVATVHMDGRNQDGLCEWSATASGQYDEGNGYTATLEVTVPAVFYWEKQVLHGEIDYILYSKGKAALQTFRNGDRIDDLELAFTKMQAYW